MLLTKKHKLIIGITILVAAICLVSAILFLKKEEPVTESSQLDTSIYEDVLHSLSTSGSFNTNLSELAIGINSKLPEGHSVQVKDNMLFGTIVDPNNYPIYINPLSNNYIEIISVGSDGLLNTLDDIKIGVLISINDNIATTTTNKLNNCKHDYKTLKNTAVSCMVNGVEIKECLSCGQDETILTLATGHKFTDESCSTISECIHCHATKNEETHLFIYMDPTLPYLAREGSCTVQSEYFFRCVYCMEKDVRTYTYLNVNNHKQLYEDKIVIDENIILHQLICRECDNSILSGVIKGYAGLPTNMIQQPIIYTKDIAMYSLDGETYTTTIPSFSTIGNNNVYYKLTDGVNEINGSLVIALEDKPILTIDQFETTSSNSPYMSQQSLVTLSGTVSDTHGIQVFRINGHDVNFDANGKWTYSEELDSDTMRQWSFFVMDNHGYQISVSHFIAQKINTDHGQPSNPAINTNIIHTSEASVVLSGHVSNLGSFKKLLVDGKEIAVNEEGYWSTEVTCNLGGGIKVVKIITMNIDNKIPEEGMVQTITICHCRTAPIAEFVNIKDNILTGIIKDNSDLGCSTIETVKVYGVNDLNGVILNNANINGTVIDNGFIVYQHQKDDIDNIDVTIDLNNYDKVKYFELEITTTHGQHVLYQFELTWIGNKVSVVDVTIKNLINGVVQEMTLPVWIIN